MKQFILPVLLWTMAISQSFTQNALPPSAQKQIERLPRVVKTILTQFSHPDTAPSRNTSQARSNPLQLDSTITFYDYSLSGVPDSAPLFRTVYQYPQPSVTIETEFVMENGSWLPTNQSTQHLDGLDRPIEVLTETYEPSAGTWVWETKSRVTPHGTSMELLDSLEVLEWDVDLHQWLLASKTKNTYGAQDRLLTTETTFDLDGSAALFVQQYAYNANGDNHLIETFLVSGPLSLPFGKQELQYVNHQVIQVIQYTTNGLGGVEPSERTTYAYNAAKLLSQQNDYIYMQGVNDWNPTATQYLEYDNANRLTEKEVLTHEIGFPDQKELVHYGYIQDEQLALVTTFLWNPTAGEYELNDRQYFYYDGTSAGLFPTKEPVSALQLFPNPAIGAVQISLESSAEVLVLDATGKQIERTILQPGTSLNLITFPAGLYEVVARTEGGLYTGKLIKQ